MKKRIIFLLIFALTLSVAQNECGGGGESGPTITDPFIGGTGGVTINFEEGFPPEFIFDSSQTPFDVIVKLENVGEWLVPKNDVMVKIEGIRPEQFGKTSSDFIKIGVEEDLLQTKKNSENDIIEGIPVYVDYENLAFNEKIEGNFNPPIRASVCYKYGTRAVSNICIVPDLLQPADDNDLCKINENKQVFNSAGPIQVTEFKEIARSTDAISFTFKLKHKGSGLFYSPETRCGGETASRLKNKVKINVDSGLDGLTCTGQDSDGNILLQGGERPITCIQRVTSQTAYENRVNIEITYDYLEDATQYLLIKHSE
ncbi:hypothetical protein HOC11_01215 [archaeon]|nr:hypothetical protein [archaeon]